MTYKRSFTTDPSAVKRAEELLKAHGMTISEYVRQAINYLAEGNDLPFKMKHSGVRRGRPYKASAAPLV